MIEKYPIYVRIAKAGKNSVGGFKVEVSKKKDNRAIVKSSYDKTALPTLQFKLNVFIDNKEFDEVKKTLDISLENMEPAIEVAEEDLKDE